jgi:enoyl-CoA hydratase/carnithine racemase
MNALVVVSDPRPAVRVIALNRPEKKNALTRAMYDAVSAALRAAELLLLGEPLNAATAERWGLVNAVCPEAEPMDRVFERAEVLAAKPARIVRLIKRLLRTPANSVPERAEEELRLLAEQLDAPEAKEAMQAFIERRRPDFYDSNRSYTSWLNFSVLRGKTAIARNSFFTVLNNDIFVGYCREAQRLRGYWPR